MAAQRRKLYKAFGTEEQLSAVMKEVASKKRNRYQAFGPEEHSSSTKKVQSF